MENINIKKLINLLNLEQNLKEELYSQIVNRQIMYKEDVLDFVLVYISKLKTFTKDKILLQISSKSGLKYEDLIARLEWLQTMELTDVQLHKNHMEVYDVFDNLNMLFKDNSIEHYYTSGILAFLLVGRDLERYHHDIDVFVNEVDLEKLEDISSMYGFSFYRKFGDRKDGTKRIMLKMQYKDIDIPITVFMYEREKDNSITQKDYYYDITGDLMVELIYNNELSAKLSFNDEIQYFHNIPYKSISLEALYLCKKGGRPKDEYDCEIFKNFVNQDKLENLINAINLNKPSESIILKDNLRINFLTKSNNKGFAYEDRL